MRFTTAQYLEKEVVTVSCRNNNAALAILDGQPVFLQSLNQATNFGTDATNYNEASGLGTFAGIAKWSKLAGNSVTISGAQVGDVFEAVAYGFTDAIIARQTRAATTDSWASAASHNAGHKVFFNGGDGDLLALGTAGPGNSDPVYPLILGESVAAFTGAGSESSNMVGLAWTQRMKVFVRAM